MNLSDQILFFIKLKHLRFERPVALDEQAGVESHKQKVRHEHHREADIEKRL